MNLKIQVTYIHLLLLLILSVLLLIIPCFDVSDFDIPIAHRKGTCKFVKYLIPNYLFYDKLSNSRKAFTSKITNLFVPRNIQEALNDLNWKLAAWKR